MKSLVCEKGILGFFGLRCILRFRLADSFGLGLARVSLRLDHRRKAIQLAGEIREQLGDADEEKEGA